MSVRFRGLTIDDDPQLLDQSYRLRYQVYCLERKFLPAEDYPDHREVDEFDRDSIHVGVLDAADDLIGTARIVRAGGAGLPLFRHCTLFPDETTLDAPGHTVVEVSRVCISRHYARRRDDGPFGGPMAPDGDDPVSVAANIKRRQRRAEPLLTLLKAMSYGAKRAGATHVIGATDAALHRMLVYHGLPYRVAGPEVDYYGRVAPYIMSFVELDRVILGGQFSALDDFPVGSDPELWPTLDQYDGQIERAGTDDPVIPIDRLVGR